MKTKINSKLRSKQTSDQLQARLAAFEEVFGYREPHIHAFVPEKERFARLRKEAAGLVRKFRKPGAPPLLFGMLVGVKDVFHVDGFDTRAGSHLPARALRGAEAQAVSRLKRAGALIAGKTRTTEFAYFTPGPTRNPHNPEHTPGGSSSGSAAAAAAGLVDLALGTQTIGSIIRPASFCGVAGYKPSQGRVSADGLIPLAPSLDHVGLLAQRVDTIQHAAPVLVKDWRGQVGGEKPVLAIPSGEYLQRASEEMREHLQSVAGRLRQAGYGVKSVNALDDFEAAVERHSLILAAEAAQVHAPWRPRYKHLYSEKLAALLERGKAISQAQLQSAQEGAQQLRRELATLMDIHGFQLWLTPAAVGAAPEGLASTGDPVMNLPWTQAGLPALGLPSGWDAAGMPLGTQFVAGFGQDEELLSWGAQIEAILAEGK